MQGNPLDALRDIYVPDAASWWPLALGYWLLLGLCVIAALAYARRYRSLRTRRSAQRAFDQIVKDHQQHNDGLRLAREFAVLMRRVMLSLQPRQDVARLTGQEWVEAVQNLSYSHQLKETSLEVLGASVYQSVAEIDADALIADCTRWFAQLPARSSSFNKAAL